MLMRILCDLDAPRLRDGCHHCSRIDHLNEEIFSFIILQSYGVLRKLSVRWEER